MKKKKKSKFVKDKYRIIVVAAWSKSLVAPNQKSGENLEKYQDISSKPHRISSVKQKWCQEQSKPWKILMYVSTRSLYKSAASVSQISSTAEDNTSREWPHPQYSLGSPRILAEFTTNQLEHTRDLEKI